MEVNIGGQGGAYGDVFTRYDNAVIELPPRIPVRVETLDHGMVSGAPSVAFIIELPELGKVLVAQTSVKLFQFAAVAMMGKYGDLTGGALAGFLSSGTASLTLSAVVKCPNCDREIPGSCKYCPECGAVQ